MMNLTRLRYFLAIIDAGSLTAAADELMLSQPALSRQIATLEREVGTPLFQRAGRSNKLTAAGGEFAIQARSLLEHADRLARAAGDLAAGRVAALTIAAPHATINEVLAPFIANLQGGAPLVTAIPIPSLESPRAALDRADLVVTAGPADLAHDSLTLGRVPVCAHVAPDHPWASKLLTQVDVTELAGESIIVQTPDNRSRVLLDGVLADRGISTRTAATSELETVVQALAAAGHGIGVLTETPRYGVHAVQLFDRDQRLEIVLRASWLPGHYAATEIASLASQLHAFMADRDAALGS